MLSAGAITHIDDESQAKQNPEYNSFPVVVDK